MLAHVLVPLDGSVLARSALDYALNIVGDHGEITLLTVLQPPEIPIYDFYPVTMSPQKDYEAGFKEALAHAKDYLYRVSIEIQDRYAIGIDTVVTSGDPATEIVANAGRLGVNAIVISTHGRSGLSRLIFGSVTQKVLAESPLPVFVIPARDGDVSKPAASQKVEPA